MSIFCDFIAAPLLLVCLFIKQRERLADMSINQIELQAYSIPTEPPAVYHSSTSRTPVTPSLRTIRTDNTEEVSIAETDVQVEHVVSKSGTMIIILSTTLVTGIGSMLNGLVTVSLPSLAVDLELQKSLQLW